MEKILIALRRIPNRFRRESDLQDAVALALSPWRNQPEYALGRYSRIDFATFTEHGYLDIGIECKVAGSSTSILRQLYRYADHFSRLVLVTATPVSFAEGILTDSNGRPCDLRIIHIWQNPTERAGRR